MTQQNRIEDGNEPVTKEQIIESLSNIEKSAGLYIRIAELKIFKKLHQLTKESEITEAELTILRAIGLNPGLRQGVLADVLHIKWPSMTKLISSLELRRLIKRVVPTHNRRSIELFLTDDGEAMVEKYGPIYKKAEQDIFSMLNDDEYQQLETLLRKVSGWVND